ncbi:TRAP transporter substrate-binding protein [Bordetella bronchiseptica]|uniref:TRAP transporter substrate-binding protein n=1 Tax=Bordetella bronchiseptica TaxID=518 RepID=UPI003F74A46C
MMHKTFAAALFALGLAGSAPAMAQKPVELTLSSWLPPTHAVVADFLMPWGEEIRKATDGRVTLRLLPKAVTNPAGHFDAVRDGLVDMTFVSHAYYPGRFQLTKFAVLPFSGDTATSRSIAAWDTYEKYLLKADEHKGVRLLGIYAHGPGIAFTTSKPVKQIDDFQGLKIRVGGGMAADVAKALGASPIAKPAPESYELLSTGVADGVFFPAESLVSFKLDSIIRHATEFPGGLYSDTHAVIINRDAFARLSKQDQDTLVRLSGRHLAELAGRAWDKHDAAARKVLEGGEIELVKADDALVEAVRESTKGFEQAWLDAAKAKGIDGPAALASFRAEIKQLDQQR